MSRFSIFTYLLLLTLGLGAQSPAFALELQVHRAEYKAEIEKGVSMKGVAIRELQKTENGLWRYSFAVDSMIAEISETSLLDYQNNQVIPLKYQYKLSGFWIKNRHQDVEFDWSKKLAAGAHDKKTWQLPIPQQAQDRLSYQLQLLVDVPTLAHMTDKQKLYEVVHKGKLRDNTFAVIGEEQLETKLGRFDSYVMEKVRDDNKRHTRLWFSKKHPMLLLKMTQRESDGESYEINLVSASIEGETLLAE